MLQSRLIEDGSSSVEVYNLYKAFDFEMKEAGTPIQYSKRIFLDHILNVFPNAAEKRDMSKFTVTIYTGIGLVQMEVTEPNHVTTINISTSQKLHVLLPDTVSNIKVRKDNMQFAIGSGQYCDGIIKNVTLFYDGTSSGLN